MRPESAALTAGAPALPVAHRILGPAILAWSRARVTGAGHVPGAGGALVAANHCSLLDLPVLGAACPRPPRFLGKRELAQGLVGLVTVRLAGMVAVDRGRADLAAVDTVVRLLRAGAVIAVFPEGTRSPTGELHRFRSGLARIAAAAQVPTVPTAIVGTAEAWPRGARLPGRRPPRGQVQVHFAPPLEPPGPEPAARRAFTAAVHRAVAARSGQRLADRFAPVGTVAQPSSSRSARAADSNASSDRPEATHSS